MAKLLSIFTRKSAVSPLVMQAGGSLPEPASFVEKDGRLDAALFGDLGEKTSDIRSAFTDLDGRLVHVTAMSGEITDLRRKFEYFLKLYHELASLNVSLAREKERLEADLRDAVEKAAGIEAENDHLRSGFERNRAKLEKALANIESHEQAMQLLGIAKRELEEQLHETEAARATLADEEGLLRQECEALTARVEADNQRIAELSAKYQDASVLAASLRDRCEATEGDLRLKGEQAAHAADENARLAHEVHQLGKEKAHLEKLVTDGQAEMAAAFEQGKKDIRARDERLGEIESQLKLLQSQHHLLQNANADRTAESERLAKELRAALEVGRQREAEIARYQTKVSRLESDGEAASAARKQLDQARLAMVARVEALSQTLRDREIDVRRLESEAAGLAKRNQDMEASFAASLEQLNMRIHELEGQLEHQVNEYAYLSSTFRRAESE